MHIEQKINTHAMGALIVQLYIKPGKSHQSHLQNPEEKIPNVTRLLTCGSFLQKKNTHSTK